MLIVKMQGFPADPRRYPAPAVSFFYTGSFPRRPITSVMILYYNNNSNFN
jgi:hypothetical protein